MRVLFYTVEPRPAAETLCAHLEHTMPQVKLVLVATLAQLIHHLLVEQKLGLLIILVISRESELDELESIQYLFDHIPLLLCLPNEQERLVCQGYRLQPRFLTTGEQGLKELTAVVEKYFVDFAKRNHSTKLA